MLSERRGYPATMSGRTLRTRGPQRLGRRRPWSPSAILRYDVRMVRSLVVVGLVLSSSLSVAQTQRDGCEQTVIRIQTACLRIAAAAFAPTTKQYRDAAWACETVTNSARNSCSASVSAIAQTTCSNGCDDAFFYCGESCANSTVRTPQYAQYPSCIMGCSIGRSSCGNRCPPPRPAQPQPQPQTVPRPAPVYAPPPQQPPPQPPVAAQPMNAPPPAAAPTGQGYIPPPAYTPPPPQPSLPPQAYAPAPSYRPADSPPAGGGQPTREETAAFLERFILANSTYQDLRWDLPRIGFVASAVVGASFRDCRIHLRYAQYRCGPKYDNACPVAPPDSTFWIPQRDFELSGPLRGFDPARIEAKMPKGVGDVIIPIGPGAANDPVLGNGAPMKSHVIFHLKTFDAAKRVVNAMKHLITLCGGQTDPF